MTVSTFQGRRVITRYRSIRYDETEVLVSLDLVRYLRNLHIYLDKFLMFRFLKARVVLSNGLVMGGNVPNTIGTIGKQPWVWRPR